MRPFRFYLSRSAWKASSLLGWYRKEVLNFAVFFGFGLVNVFLPSYIPVCLPGPSAGAPSEFDLESLDAVMNLQRFCYTISVANVCVRFLPHYGGGGQPVGVGLDAQAVNRKREGQMCEVERSIPPDDFEFLRLSLFCHLRERRKTSRCGLARSRFAFGHLVPTS